jgi:hypothetical protein
LQTSRAFTGNATETSAQTDVAKSRTHFILATQLALKKTGTYGGIEDYRDNNKAEAAQKPIYPRRRSRNSSELKEQGERDANFGGFAGRPVRPLFLGPGL